MHDLDRLVEELGASADPSASALAPTARLLRDGFAQLEERVRARHDALDQAERIDWAELTMAVDACRRQVVVALRALGGAAPPPPASRTGTGGSGMR